MCICGPLMANTSLGPIAIIGMGHAGQAMAADLISRGFEVPVLVESDQAKGAALNQRGAIRLIGYLGEREVPIPTVTTDVSAAATCRWLMVATSADGHAPVGRALVGKLGPDQTVVLHTGYVGGSNTFIAALGATRNLGPTVVEANTMIYFACSPAPGEVHVNGIKRWIEVAGPGSEDGAQVAEAIRPIFPQFVGGSSALANGLNNPNPVLHLPTLLLNYTVAEREWTGVGVATPVGGFFHLNDYMSPTVRAMSAAMEDERVALMKGLGLADQVVTLAQFVANCYGPDSKELQPPPRLGPTFQRRFIEEDLPCGLVPMVLLAERVGVKVPVMAGMLDLFEQMLQRDFRRTGRSADLVMGLQP